MSTAVWVIAGLMGVVVTVWGLLLPPDKKQE